MYVKPPLSTFQCVSAGRLAAFADPEGFRVQLRRNLEAAVEVRRQRREREEAIAAAAAAAQQAELGSPQ